METATQPTQTETAPTQPGPAPEAVTAPPRGSQTTPEGTSPPEVEGERDESGRYLSREAANYRRRLRDTETERDTLRERLDGYERAEVERIAGQAGLAVASDVWIHGATVETLRGEDGTIDRPTVEGLVQDLVKDRPGLQASKPGSVGIGLGAAARPPQQPKLGLSALLKPGR